MKPKIVVIGSANTDFVAGVSRFPQPGETVMGHGFTKFFGGKGANQAVSAARLGAEVAFVARLGKDVEGDEALHHYQNEGINTDFISRDDSESSGAALIMVDTNGENIIAVAPGANSKLTPNDIEMAEIAIKDADCVLLQLEIPLESVDAGIKLANKHNVQVILNPAPAVKLPSSMLKMVDVLTPNEPEATILSDNLEILAKNVVITKGAIGALIAGKNELNIPGYKVDVIDTTGAGDAFNGGLAFALASGIELKSAVAYANAVGALATTKAGAQSAMPTSGEVNEFIKAHGQYPD